MYEIESKPLGPLLKRINFSPPEYVGPIASNEPSPLVLIGLLMANLATADEFSDAVYKDFNWRLQELSNLKLAVFSSNSAARPTFLRALVVMCYAHWEGHVKYCADNFVNFITIRRLRFSDLSLDFYAIRFVRELGAAGNLGYQGRRDLVRKIISSHEDRLSAFPRELIDTRSNLNSEVLMQLCMVCNIDFQIEDADSDFIDRFLLKRRNQVAHGEAVFIDAVDPDQLIAKTTSLMRMFRDLIDNSVAQSSYRRT